jgi:hypothetical protein
MFSCNEFVSTFVFTYQNASLCHCVFYLISPDYLSFLEHLKGIQLPGVSLLDEHNFSIGSLANDTDHLEVLFGDITARSPLLLGNNILVLLLELLVLLGQFLLGVLMLLLLELLLLLSLLLFVEGLLLFCGQLRRLGLRHAVDFHFII